MGAAGVVLIVFSILILMAKFKKMLSSLIPIYYEDQKSEALTYTRHFVAERLPKFLGYFERVLGGAKGRCMVGSSLSYVDLSMFQLFEGLRFSFPKTMQRVEPDYPGLRALHDRIAVRPNIAAYLKSPRRIPFNDRGVFRHYPELDEVTCPFDSHGIQATRDTKARRYLPAPLFARSSSRRL